MEAFAMIEGVAVRYSDFGRGDRTVLLLHGYAESLEVWDIVAGELGKEFRVIRPDLPGSGFSDWGGRDVIHVDFMACVVLGLLDKLGIDRAVVVGHSMGGYVAVAMAEQSSLTVEKLVFFHSSPYGDTAEKRDNRKREILLLQEGKKELLASVNPSRGFAPNNVRRCREAIDELAEQIMLTDDSAMIATLNGMAARPDRSDFVKSAPMPIMFIFGQDDSYIPMEAAIEMERRFPSAKVVWLEGSGHMGLVEQPDRAVEVLKSFMLD